MESLKQHGGKRTGAGRKPSASRLVNIQAKVTPELKQWLIGEADMKGVSLSKLISTTLDRVDSMNWDTACQLAGEICSIVGNTTAYQQERIANLVQERYSQTFNSKSQEWQPRN